MTVTLVLLIGQSASIAVICEEHATMKIRQNASFAGAVMVFLLSLATLGKVPTTVHAYDCSFTGQYVGADCVGAHGCGTQGCFSCVANACWWIGGAGEDTECTNTCLTPANYVCQNC